MHDKFTFRAARKEIEKQETHGTGGKRYRGHKLLTTKVCHFPLIAFHFYSAITSTDTPIYNRNGALTGSLRRTQHSSVCFDMQHLLGW